VRRKKNYQSTWLKEVTAVEIITSFPQRAAKAKKHES
jgi:hypothetical protein